MTDDAPSGSEAGASGRPGEPQKPYGTRAAPNRRRPVGLEGFVIDHEQLAPKDTPLSTPAVRPLPRRFDSASARTSFFDLSRRQSDSGTQGVDSSGGPEDEVPPSSQTKAPALFRSASSTSTRSGTAACSGSSPILQASRAKSSALASGRLSLPSLRLSQPSSAAAVNSQRSLAQRSAETSGRGLMPPPTLPYKDLSVVALVDAEDDGDEENLADGSGLDAGHPIDFTSDDSVVTNTKKGAAKRKDIDAPRALEIALASWKRAHQDEADKQAAKQQKVEYKPAPGKVASDIYLCYHEPKIGLDKHNATCIVFPCKCCKPSASVTRPLTESSTSNLRSHVRIKGSKLEQRSIMDMFGAPSSSNTRVSAPLALSRDVTRQISVAWVTKKARPISIVEDEDFLDLLTEQQREVMPKRMTVSRDIERIYKGMTRHLINELAGVGGCFHLALDLWTSANGYAFLAMIICYQSEGRAIRRLLDMVPFLDKHDASHLAKAVFDTLEKFNVSGRLWNIVSDNASENTKMMTLLAAMDGLPRFKLDEETSMSCRVRCSAHVLNLISKAIIKGFEPRKKKQAQDGAGAMQLRPEDDWTEDLAEDDADESEDDDGDGANVFLEDDLEVSTALNPENEIDAATEEAIELENILDTASTPAASLSPESAARMQRELELRNKEINLAIRKLAWLSSKLRWNSRLRKLFRLECIRMSCETPHTLLRDVATRWDSTKDMIERGLRLWYGVIAFTERSDTAIPKAKRLQRSDETNLRKLLELLKPLADATLKFSMKQTPTIGEVIGMFEDLDGKFVSIQNKSDEEHVWKVAAARGHLVSAKYYGLTEQADVYNFAFLLHPNYRTAFMKLMKWPRDWQNKAIERLRQCFQKHYELPIETSQPQLGSQTEDFDKLDDMAKGLMKLSKEHQQSARPRDPVGDWLEDLTPLGADGKRVDPLLWWWEQRKKGCEHHGLTSMALDVFSCPATSVDVERLFSKAGRHVTPLRHKLKAEKITQLVTVGKWFLEGSVPDDLMAKVLGQEAKVRQDKRKAKALDRERSKKRAKSSSNTADDNAAVEPSQSNRIDDDDNMSVNSDADDVN